MIQIECKNMSIGYENKVIAKNINFSVNQGDYVYIFGDNGIGKTTLLKTILGLYPHQKGELKYDSSIKQSTIGYLPQKSKIQQEFPASVYEIVISGCLNRLKWRFFYHKAEKESVANAMKLLNISRLAKRPFRELSGGLQQRVLLARAFCATEKIMVLDEPFVGLDQYSTDQLYKSLDKINKELGVTIIIVSHYVEEAISHCSKIIVLQTEKTISYTPEEYRQAHLVTTPEEVADVK